MASPRAFCICGCYDSSTDAALFVNNFQVGKIGETQGQKMELDIPPAAVLASTQSSEVDTPYLQRTSQSIGEEEENDGGNWYNRGLLGGIS